MIENFKHVNCENDVLDFVELGIYANYNDLRDYEYAVETSYNKITSLTRSSGHKTIPFVFNCDEEQAIEIKNKFYEHFDIDVMNMKKGYFEINGYKLYGYVTKSTKSQYLLHSNILKISIEFAYETNTWLKETVTSYLDYQDDDTTYTNSKTYSYEYDYIYGEPIGVSTIVNSSLSNSNFKLYIYGPVTNPSVIIGSNLYNVDVELETGEYLLIDSVNKKIIKVDINGNEENVFDYRNKEYYIFEKIKKNSNNIQWNGLFRFDVVIIDERSEPKWI